MLEHSRRIVRKFVGRFKNMSQIVPLRGEILLTNFFRWYHHAVTSPEYLAAKLANCPDRFRSSISTSIP